MLKKGWFYYAAVTTGCAVALWIATFFTHRLDVFLVLLVLAVFLGFGITATSCRREYASLNEFWVRCCKPLAVLTIVVFLYAFFNFFITAFMVGGAPEKIQSGFYLVNHGSVLRILTEEEYVRFKMMESRSFFGHLTAFSGMATTCFSARVPGLWTKNKKTARDVNEKILVLDDFDADR